MFFRTFFAFSIIQQILAVCPLVPLPFLNPAWTSGNSWLVEYCWSLVRWFLEHNFANMWNECNCMVVWTFFGITLLWDWNENWHFQSCGHWYIFQICWHSECSILSVSFFMFLNSSAGIASHPRALFILILPKAHLTLQSTMSGYRWVDIPSWLSGSLRPFSVFLPSLLNLFCFYEFLLFLSFILLILPWNVSLIALIFLNLSSFPFCCFPLFLCIFHLTFLFLFALLWNSAFSWIYLSLAFHFSSFLSYF